MKDNVVPLRKESLKKPRVSESELKDGLSPKARKIYDDFIPGRWFYSLGQTPELQELVRAGLLITKPNPLKWPDGPAYKRPKGA